MSSIRFVFLLLALAGCRVKENADLIITNANVMTLDERQTRAEAVAIRDGKILAVGGRASIAGRFATTRTEDVNGALVLPGFTDAHLHLMGIGRALQQVNLTGTTAYAEVLDRVKDRLRTVPAGRWVRGRGWDQNDWAVRDFPDHTALSALSPEHFVYLTRVDGHAVLVNRKVLELCGITKATRDPSGGKILRNAQGEPTGVFIDNAIDLITPFIPVPTYDEDSTALAMAMDTCSKAGLTSVHDAGVDMAMLSLYEDFGRRRLLNLRIYAMLEGSLPGLLDTFFQRGPQKDLQGGFLSIAAIKFYADGALGSRGAALLEPYSDQPGHSGLILTETSVLERIANTAIQKGFQVGVHAIGDRGNRMVLDIYERAFAAQHVAGASVRFRIEHAQVLSDRDIPRLAAMGVIASMQPTHATSDMYWAEERLGPARIKGAYAWRRLMNEGTIIACGSDAPVESFAPLWGIYAAVTRQDPKGWPDGGWFPGDRMTVLEAIRGFTTNAAYAAFEETKRGSIEPGKSADLVVLSRDITAIPPADILKTDVLMTIVDGRIVYRY